MTESYLPEGIPQPQPARDGLDAPYWEGTRRHELLVQRCASCGTWQWGPEWLCHKCHSFEIGWEAPAGEARLFSWERSWHPVHPALVDAVPYLVGLVEFPDADGIRMIGNFVGEPTQDMVIGAKVAPVFEDHDAGDPPYTLVHWEYA